MSIGTDRRAALAADRDDPLAHWRNAFHLPGDDDAIYLCGNSLGLQPKTAEAIVLEELADWRRLGVEGHFHARRPWMPYHEQVTRQTATLVGALPGEVVAMNTLTVNLHLMMVSFFRPTRERFRILIESPAFPSDRYAVVSQLRYHGLDPDDALIEIGPDDGDDYVRMDRVAECLQRDGSTIALVLLPGVQYYSGQVFDMAGLAALAHRQGCIFGLDLAHAVGNVPLALHDWGVDFAVWCSYKYLNAGPGAIAGCFVHERHGHDETLPRFAGWWGHDKSTRFRMGPEFAPIAGAEGWQLSNPPILSLAPLVASLDIFDAAGMTALRDKSARLTGLLADLIDERLGDAVRIVTPRRPDERGCQLSLVLADASRGRAVFDALARAGVVCDWREPDVIRVAPVPLYNRYVDVYRFVEKLSEAIV